MARGVAHCTCKKCGKKFEQMKYDFYNSSDAHRWVKWAEDYYDLCTDCYNEDQTNKKMEEGYELREVKYRDYKLSYPHMKTVPNSYDPKNKTIKILYKSLGLTPKGREYRKTTEEYIKAILFRLRPEIRNLERELYDHVEPGKEDACREIVCKVTTGLRDWFSEHLGEYIDEYIPIDEVENLTPTHDFFMHFLCTLDCVDDIENLPMMKEYRVNKSEKGYR